jgi:hypothetical protein
MYRRGAFAPAVALVAALVLMACVAVVPVGAATKTTEPDKPYKIPVLVTDTSIRIQPDPYTIGNTQRYLRGSIIIFLIKNVGKHPHSVQLKLLSGHTQAFLKYEQKVRVVPAGKTPIQPGRLRNLPINFYYRATFALQLMIGGKPRASALISIL